MFIKAHLKHSGAPVWINTNQIITVRMNGVTECTIVTAAREADGENEWVQVRESQVQIMAQILDRYNLEDTSTKEEESGL